MAFNILNVLQEPHKSRASKVTSWYQWVAVPNNTAGDCQWSSRSRYNGSWKKYNKVCSITLMSAFRRRSPLMEPERRSVKILEPVQIEKHIPVQPNDNGSDGRYKSEKPLPGRLFPSRCWDISIPVLYAIAFYECDSVDLGVLVRYVLVEEHISAELIGPVSRDSVDETNERSRKSLAAATTKSAGMTKSRCLWCLAPSRCLPISCSRLLVADYQRTKQFKGSSPSKTRETAT